MDKLSKLLICAVSLSVCVNAVVLLAMWIPDEEAVSVNQPISLGQVEEERQWADIAVDQDTRVINGSGQDIWIRVFVDIPEVNGEPIFQMQSNTVSVKGNKKGKGAWISAEDGWYYYRQTVHPGEQTAPLFYDIKELKREVCFIPGGEGIEIKAQAVQVNWVPQNISDGEDAFKSFRDKPLEDQVAQLI